MLQQKKVAKGDRFQVKSSRGLFLFEERDTEPSKVGTTILHGETGIVLEDVTHGFLPVQMDLGGYCGYIVPGPQITSCVKTATHRVSVPSAKVFFGTHKNAGILGALSLNSLVTVGDESSERIQDQISGGWIVADNLVRIDHVACDWVSVCESLLGLPYFWGGRDFFHGYDCSGLIQAGLIARGIRVPQKTSKMINMDILGRVVYDVSEGDIIPPLRRGDIVFFRGSVEVGHVGVMQNPSDLLHATGYHRAVVSEPLSQVIDRRLIDGHAGGIMRIRRL